jgi:peptide/nickel transport system substrate-binding protein
VFGDRYAVIEQTTIVDDRTIVLELSEPAPDLELALSRATAGVLPANYGGRTRADFLHEPLGAGPHRILSWDPGRELVLAPNPVHHRAGGAAFDTVTVTAEPDDASRVAAFRRGAADVATIRSWHIPELPIDRIVRAGPRRLTFVGLNRSRPVGDLAVTGALAATLDYSAMADQPEHTLAVPYGADGLTTPEIDPAAAAALGQAELIFDATDREHQRLAESIQAGVTGLGHYLQLTALDPETLIRRRAEGDYDLILVRTDTFERQTDLADDAELVPLVAHRAVFARDPAVDGFAPHATGTWWFDEVTRVDEPEQEPAEG